MMDEIKHGVIDEVGGMLIRHHKTGIPYGYMEGKWTYVWAADWFNMTRGEGRLLRVRPHRYISNPKDLHANRTAFVR